MAEKLNHLNCILHKENNLEELKHFGRTHGFLNNVHRKQAWKLLLGMNTSSQYYEWFAPSQTSPQYDQILKDVNRSLNTIDVCELYKEGKHVLRDQLLEGLDQIFFDLPKYKYYQGYHDILSIYIFVFGEDQGFLAAKRAADLFYKEYLEKPFDVSVIPQLDQIRNILVMYAEQQQHDELQQILREVPQISFPVPWLLTWFSHSLANFKDIVRIWDYLLCSPPAAVLYLSAAFIIFHVGNLENDMNDYMCTMQIYFQHIDSKQTDIEYVLGLTTILMENFPQEKSIAKYAKEMKVEKQIEEIDKIISQSKEIILPVIGIIVSIWLNKYMIS